VERHGSMPPTSAPSLAQMVTLAYAAKANSALLGPVAPTLIVSTVGTVLRMQAKNVRFRANLGLQWIAQMIWGVGHTLPVKPPERVHMRVDPSP